MPSLTARHYGGDVDTPSTLRVLVVPGVNPGRWVSTWRTRFPLRTLEVMTCSAAQAEQQLLSGQADIGFVRLPLAEGTLASIPLWTEVSVVVASKESDLTVVDELTLDNLLDEVIVVAGDNVLQWDALPGQPFDGLAPDSTADAIELAAAQAGVVIVPAALAREHTRKDVRTIALADGPTSQIALAWLQIDGENPTDVEDFIGVVRGRTANSSRGRAPAASEVKVAKTAKAKAAAAARKAKAPAPRAGNGRRRTSGGRGQSR